MHAQRLYESVKDVSFDKADVNPIETLGQLKYLDNFLKEVQRLHPIVPILPRVSTDECEIGGQVFPKGTMFLGNIQQVQRTPEYYKEPLVFNPDRWADDTAHTPGSFMTFGDGPHQCVGMKMALIELRIIIIEMVKTFNMKPVPGHSVTVYSTITTGIREGLVSDVSLRNEAPCPDRPPKVPASEIICEKFNEPAPSHFISRSKAMVRLVPAVLSAAIKHFTVGPLRKEWNLGYSILVQVLKATLFRAGGKLNANEMQRSNRRASPVPSSCIVEEDAFFTSDSVIDFIYNSSGSGEFAAPANQIVRVQAEWVMANNARDPKSSSAIIILIHGGGMIIGSPAQHRGLAHSLSRTSGGLPVYSVDYRLAPQHPFPCALIDCVSSYLYLQNRFPHARIIIAGDSAGGNLGLALLQVLADMQKMDKEKIVLPAACVFVSPWVDVCDSLRDAGRANTDYIPSIAIEGKSAARDARLTGRMHLHVHDSFLNHRYVSPCKGSAEIVKTGVPLYILAGEGEKLHNQIVAFTHDCAKVAKEQDENTCSRLELGIYHAHTHDFPMFESISVGAKRSLERAGAWIVQQLSSTAETRNAKSKISMYSFDGDFVSSTDL